MPPADPPPDCWLHPDVRIAPSVIAGKGLVATAPISAGTVVSRLGGRLVSTAELDAIVGSSAGYVDSITVDDDVQLVMPPMRPNHYLNHSCDPNLWWLDEYTLAARQDIAAGAELSTDYATSSCHPRLLMNCHCQTYRCRQLIAGDDWRIPELQVRYTGHWVPYLQLLIDSANQAPHRLTEDSV